MLYYVMLCYVILCYIMLCYIMLYYIMLYYIMLYYVMLYYVMLCYIILYYIHSTPATCFGEICGHTEGCPLQTMLQKLMNQCTNMRYQVLKGVV